MLYQVIQKDGRFFLGLIMHDMLGDTLGCIGALLMVLVWLFHAAAIVSGVEYWLDLHWIIAVPVGLILAFCPLIASILGVLGAVTVWHWSWSGAILLFFGAGIVIVRTLGSLLVLWYRIKGRL